jgi:hypothetical protein|tara:strand:+ start:59 stop:361 length:303 start_codon:yes stop_codon:yes gene_type:complete
MSAIVNFSINVEDIDKSKLIKGKKGSYLNLTMSINDETKFGNNASVSVSQSKEEREAKEAKTYLGNGKVVWMSDAGVTVAEREQELSTSTSAASQDDLPF